MEHLQEIETSAQNQLDLLMGQLIKQNNVTKELKARDQMAWVGITNSLKTQAEETVFTELVFS